MKVNLKGLRGIHKLTQQELADALQISKSTVQNWETNKSKPSQENVDKIIEYFEINYSDLFF
jgi:DNA-binding XRE family transcriptional regulator